MEKIERTPDFRTSELPLAAALVALGYELTGVEGDDTKRYDFCFRGSSEILVTERQYYDGELLVEPAKMHQAERRLKEAIRRRRRGDNGNHI